MTPEGGVGPVSFLAGKHHVYSQSQATAVHSLYCFVGISDLSLCLWEGCCNQTPTVLVIQVF